MERSSRARLITVPEAWNTGCVTWSTRTCPKYMYNFLVKANGYDGILDGTETSWGYWTMNARSMLLRRYGLFPVIVMSAME